MTQTTPPTASPGRSPFRWWILWSVLSAAIVATLSAAFVAEWRVKIQAFIFPEDRTLLATVTGPFLPDGSIFKVLKFKTPRGIILEVLSATGHAERPFVFVDRVMIPDRHDGFLKMKDQTTRLALVDMDNDGQIELIAPTFDDDLVAHINAFHLNPESRHLELVKAPSAAP